MDGWNISGWEVAMARGRRTLRKKIEELRKKWKASEEEDDGSGENGLGLSLCILFIDIGSEWGLNSP
jgi:hypothetical protein